MLATSVNFSGDTAYITSLTGDVVAVEGVSTLEPIVQPAPQPTVAPAPKPVLPGGTITPPNTGSGPTGDGGSTPLWLLAALSAAGVACLGAGAVATKR